VEVDGFDEESVFVGLELRFELPAAGHPGE
jgi:hypothetical protein